MGVPNWAKVNGGLFKMYQVCIRGSLVIDPVTDFAEGRSAREARGRAAYPLGWIDGMGGEYLSQPVRSRTGRKMKPTTATEVMHVQGWIGLHSQ